MRPNALSCSRRRRSRVDSSGMSRSPRVISFPAGTSRHSVLWLRREKGKAASGPMAAGFSTPPSGWSGWCGAAARSSRLEHLPRLRQAAPASHPRKENPRIGNPVRGSGVWVDGKRRSPGGGSEKPIVRTGLCDAPRGSHRMVRLFRFAAGGPFAAYGMGVTPGACSGWP